MINYKIDGEHQVIASDPSSEVVEGALLGEEGRW